MIFNLPNTIGFSYIACMEAKKENLFTEELNLLSLSASNKRKQEFIAGRCAAHNAQQQIENKTTPILKGEHGEPLWDSNLIGSITHSKDYAFAVVSHKKYFYSIGLDLEEMPSQNKWHLVNHICNDSEKQWASNCHNPSNRLIQLFSAKESIYKAFFPICHYSLSFHDCILHWNELKKCFYTEWTISLPNYYYNKETIVHLHSWKNFFITYCILT